MDKIDILLRNLKMFKTRTELELQKNEDEVKSMTSSLDNNDEVPEEAIKKGFYGYYLLGVLKCTDIIIDILENKDIDKILEDLEKSKEKIAKA